MTARSDCRAAEGAERCKHIFQRKLSAKIVELHNYGVKREVSLYVFSESHCQDSPTAGDHGVPMYEGEMVHYRNSFCLVFFYLVPSFAEERKEDIFYQMWEMPVSCAQPEGTFKYLKKIWEEGLNVLIS